MTIRVEVVQSVLLHDVASAIVVDHFWDSLLANRVLELQNAAVPHCLM